MPEIVWFVMGALGGGFLVFLACAGYWITHAEVGVDSFADLPTFDDDEADRLLDQGA